MDNFNWDDLYLNSLDDLRDMKKLLNDGLQAPMFRVHNTIVTRICEARLNEILKPAKDIPEVLELEFKKGEASAYRQAFNVLSVTIEMLSLAIEQKQAERDRRLAGEPQ